MKSKLILVNNKSYFIQAFEDKDFNFVYVIIFLLVLSSIFLQFHMPTEEELSNDTYYSGKVHSSVYEFIKDKETAYWKSKGYEVREGNNNNYNVIKIYLDNFSSEGKIRYKGNNLYEMIGYYSLSNMSSSIKNYFYATVQINPKRTIFLTVHLNESTPKIYFISEEEYEKIRLIILDDIKQKAIIQENIQKEKFEQDKKDYYRKNN